MLVFLQNSKHVLNGWSLSGTLLTDIVHINIPTTIEGVKFLSVFFHFSCNVEGQRCMPEKH